MRSSSGLCWWFVAALLMKSNFEHINEDNTLPKEKFRYAELFFCECVSGRNLSRCLHYRTRNRELAIMSLSTRIAPHLPYLRRFARAITGSQSSGDAYVAATLEILITDVSLFPRITLRIE